MAHNSSKDVQRERNGPWTAKRKTKAVLEILKGNNTVAATAQQNQLTEAEVEGWVAEFVKGGEARLRASYRSLRPSRSIRVFVAYNHEDEPLREELDNRLVPLTRSGLIVPWHDRAILPGTEYKDAIEERLETAEIVLLLVSQNFLGSDYCRGREMTRAIELYESDHICILPIILKPCGWQEEQFGRLRLGDFQALPKDGKPITTWRNRQNAFHDVAQGIKRCADEIRQRNEDREEDYRATLEAALASTLPAKLIAGETSLEKVQQLLQLGEIDNIVCRDSSIMPKIKEFLDDMGHGRLTEATKLLSRYGTAERAYFSQEFSTLREIGRHYERLGVLVKYGYIDINIVFQIVVFPDDFWEKTSELRVAFERHWWGDHGLPDFWENFKFLRKQYLRLRGSGDQELFDTQGSAGESM